MVTIAFNYNCTCYRPPLIPITLTMTILTICYHVVKRQRTFAAGGRYSWLWHKNTTSVRLISKFLPLMYTQIYVYAYIRINNHIVSCNHLGAVQKSYHALQGGVSPGRENAIFHLICNRKTY